MKRMNWMAGLGLAAALSAVAWAQDGAEAKRSPLQSAWASGPRPGVVQNGTTEERKDGNDKTSPANSTSSAVPKAPDTPAPADTAALMKKGQKLQEQGNWKEAFAVFEKVATDPKAASGVASNSLTQAWQCLMNLGNQKEQDALVEAAAAAHPQDRDVLVQAATIYMQCEHYGAMVAGKFERGGHRGGTAKYVSSEARDRVRALQLMQQAMPVVKSGDNGFWSVLAGMLMHNRGYAGAWELQALTDLAKLPDYEETAYGSWWGWRAGSRGAPVGADGKPVFYSIPKSWESAQNDGERWRWALYHQDPASAQFQWAQFLQNQFGVQTLAEYGGIFGRGGEADDDTQKDESGVYAVHTLKEGETIAKFATGIKRLTLPEEYNYLTVYKELAGAAAGSAYACEAAQALAQEFENRRQYDRAVEFWKRVLELAPNGGDWRHQNAQQRVDQIVKNWGQFEPVMTQPAGGKGASVEFRFRNGKALHVQAVEINLAKLLADMKAYIKSNPKQLDWEKIDLQNLGYRLVEKNQAQYLGEKVAEWDMPLAPRAGHWDRRVTVQTPLKKAGAYLVTAKMADGNLSRIILWVADTAIVEKGGDGKRLYYVCDAVTGRPLDGITLSFFGYNQRWVQDQPNNGRGHYDVRTQEFSAPTDGSGRYNLSPEGKTEYQWLVTASDVNGRLAYLGFTGVWCGNYQDAAFSQQRVFVMTDRPVYRPAQKVQWRAWADNAQYDREGKSPYAGKMFDVTIYNPKGEKVFEKRLLADQYAGFGGELELPKDAALGMYNIQVAWPGGGGSFRVEEYKKPEYEVTVEAPTEPVALGEKITATVKAKYYFGAPVTEAKVKYKVTRTAHSANWYPWGCWDWYYGPGYWWFAYDYTWYPGWSDWGCRRPAWDWCPWWRVPAPPPEVVMEGEGKIGADGTLKLEIDSAVAKALHGDTDHKYEVSAEVTDKSRRVITGQGVVLAARKPFKVYAWVDRGHYRTGDVVHAAFKAQTLDGKPVEGKGALKLFKLSYNKKGEPVEREVEKWKLPTDAQGEASLQITARAAGQYRLSYKVTDAKGHELEGGYLFCVMGEEVDAGYRFNDVEIVPDKREYAPGEPVKVRINTARTDGTVLLFVKPANGVYPEPTVLRLKGRSAEFAVPVEKRDMPNFFLEAVTVADGKVYCDVREIVVPPEKKVLNVEVKPSKTSYKPGEKGTLTVKVTDLSGQPVVGQAALTLYDKSVEYISGGSNVPEIRDFFWKWRRSHYAGHQTSLDKGGYNILKSNEIGMAEIGVFGGGADEEGLNDVGGAVAGGGRAVRRSAGRAKGMVANEALACDAAMPMPAAAPMAPMAEGRMEFAAKSAVGGMEMDKKKDGAAGGEGGQPAMVQPTVRSNFADTALWRGALELDANGEATVELTMPENLTTWKAKSWVISDACRVGEGSAETVTTKNVIVRLQAPRFFVQKDEVVLSAVVHNYLKTEKKAQVKLEVDGGCLAPLKDIMTSDAGYMCRNVTIASNGEARVDWRMRVVKPGEVKVRMSALTDEESDAMEQSFPVYIHGMLKTESFSRVVRPDAESATIELRVPAERLPEQTRLEVRYSPTLAGAMVDALPYLVDYPYGCTEQTLNRFLPTVITQKILLDMGLDLKEIQKKRTNLNAQEIGDDVKRAADWKRTIADWHHEEKNPVFEVETVRDMVKAGVERLASMQCSDGGWGWFSGYGERSWPHTTAVVVHGLQIARDCDAAVPPGMIERGVEWLKNYQAEELRKLKLPEKDPHRKCSADELDALVYMVLVDAKADCPAMREFIYRDRNNLAVYAKAMAAMACHKVGDAEKRDMLRRNIEQYLVRDAENQTAYLKLPENNWWWCWYGSEYEAHAYYLKLLALVEPKSEVAPELVKYLINNRRHATYWNSTRDTAVVIEAFANFIKATGEDAPDLNVQLLLDGKVVKDVKVTRDNLFSFDNKLVLEGAAVTDGKHTLELRKTGKGPLYANAYLTNFTLEDPITKAGLEIKVERSFYKLVPEAKTVKVEGVRGQALDQKVEKYTRVPLASGAAVKSGDLIEVELVLESKNDYEYLVFEDMKPAGCEPVDVRSGYNGNEMGAYVEFRDERVAFFVRALARGKHSVSYRVRAEIPGVFSALPAKGSAMYAPELKANSDEHKIQIDDAP